MTNPVTAYAKSSLDSKVFGETPHGLVRLLLQKLCEKLSIAHDLLIEKQSNQNQIEVAIKIATALGVASDIVQALSDSLVKLDDSELYEQLAYLYAHMHYQILMANMHQKPEPIVQSLSIAKNLLEAWESIPAELHHVSSRE
jgi:flagellar biosynthetic protein FliS